MMTPRAKSEAAAKAVVSRTSCAKPVNTCRQVHKRTYEKSVHDVHYCQPRPPPTPPLLQPTPTLMVLGGWLPMSRCVGPPPGPTLPPLLCNMVAHRQKHRYTCKLATAHAQLSLPTMTSPSPKRHPDGPPPHDMTTTHFDGLWWLAANGEVCGATTTTYTAAPAVEQDQLDAVAVSNLAGQQQQQQQQQAQKTFGKPVASQQAISRAAYTKMLSYAQHILNRGCQQHGRPPPPPAAAAAAAAATVHARQKPPHTSPLPSSSPHLHDVLLCLKQ